MYKVYYTNEYDEARSFNEDTLESALATAEGLRRNIRNSFVTMASENPDSVGPAGVDAVIDGRLPNGELYTWRKRR